MKNILIFILLFVCIKSYSQKASINFNSIDWQVQHVVANTPDSLARQLTNRYQTEMEKVRAIFTWITNNISYNTGLYNHRSYKKMGNEPWDTMTVWKSGIEMTALKVLHRKMAVCDGYAKLFKTLCDYAGLRSEIITGYARCRSERYERFRTNHSWNAVMIDSNWHLLDVTWASGYINFANEFVRSIDERYFLTPPRDFIRDHYPEDQRWTLLTRVPDIPEFRKTPFRGKSFVKYGIQSMNPANGRIHAALGDTILIELHVSDAEKNKKISPDPFYDSTMTEGLTATVFLKPQSGSTKVKYQFVVTSEAVEWLNIIYNEDMILRYRLDIIKEKAEN